MPGMGSKRNYDPSPGSVVRIVAGSRVAGRDDPAVLPGCVDDVDWPAAAALVSPVRCRLGCNSDAHGRSANTGRRSTGSPTGDRSAAPVPFHAPPCVSAGGLVDTGTRSCQPRPVCWSHLPEGDDIGASTVGAVGALLSCRLPCPPYSVLMIGRTAPPAMMLPPAQASENYVFR